MGKIEELNERLQFDRPYLYGAMVGVLFSVLSVPFDLLFGIEIDGSAIYPFGLASVVFFSLFFGLTAKDRRKRRDEQQHQG